jgi:hypothetical protein
MRSSGHILGIHVQSNQYNGEISSDRETTTKVCWHVQLSGTSSAFHLNDWIPSSKDILREIVV